MSNEELTALAGLTFNWTRALDDVWTDQRYHVDGLHAVTAALIGSGIRAVTVICPGFAADCLETLEEIALSGRDIFLASGGERFDYVPALNGRADHAGTLARLILRSTADWSPAVSSPSLPP